MKEGSESSEMSKKNRGAREGARGDTEQRDEQESIVKKRDSKEIQVQSDGPEDVEIQGE